MKLRWRPAAGPALLVIGFAALIAVLSPFHNIPVQDDWDYARTVQILLHTGAFQRSEIAQATELSSARWGAVFARFLGFSFDTLRLARVSNAPDRPGECAGSGNLLPPIYAGLCARRGLSCRTRSPV